jgi:pyranose oxidase
LLIDTEQTKPDQYDVFIAGGGIIACTFARILVDAGLRVVMADIGSQHSQKVGENLKNFSSYQNDVDQFGAVVRGLMHPVSVTPAGPPSTRHALNPRQKPDRNLPGAVVAYSLGGMAIHWTCAIPRHHETVERIPFIPPQSFKDSNSNEVEGWDRLYPEAEKRLNRHTDVHTGSVRHRVLKRVLAEQGFKVEDTPLAAERINADFVRYTGADTILGRLAEPGQSGTLTILRAHRVSHLIYQGGKIRAAVVRDLQKREEKVIHADAFVVAAGWIHTAQILWNSWIRPAALGRYLTDHTFTACQVVLSNKILAQIGEEAAKEVRESSDPYPLPVPMDDPPPHMYIPVSEDRLWHSMIFREAFRLPDMLPPNVDSRLIVDLKWFGMVDPDPSNRVIFEPDIKDRFGLPQPTFNIKLGVGDEERQHQMMGDMQDVAGILGTYLPGSGPTVVPLGASTHTMGATRMGPKDDGTSVLDPDSKVWGFDNLYVGGNCVIPTRNASNPTLTSVALALRAARHLLRSNGASTEPHPES